jgi:hypothetical protein
LYVHEKLFGKIFHIEFDYFSLYYKINIPLIYENQAAKPVDKEAALRPTGIKRPVVRGACPDPE